MSYLLPRLVGSLSLPHNPSHRKGIGAMTKDKLANILFVVEIVLVVILMGFVMSKNG